MAALNHDTVTNLIKSGQENNTDPITWSIQLSSHLRSSNVQMPSIDVSNAFVSHICWSNNVPMTWKLLHTALNQRIVSPALVIALLSVRVIPSREKYPGAYRLYLELVNKYAFSFSALVNDHNYHKVMESISDVLQFDRVFGGVHSLEPGCRVVQFVLAIVWGLLDASLDDEGLLELTPEKKLIWMVKSQDMEVDCSESVDGRRMDSQAALSKANSVMAIELIGELFRDKVTSQILYLVRRNMLMHWEYFDQHLRVLIDNSSYLRNSKNISPEVLLQLTLSHERQPKLDQQFHSVMDRSPMLSFGQYHGTILSAPWLPIDLYLEDVMDGSQVRAKSASETLTDLLKALKALNQATWQDSFHGLWIAALRLVQRERNSSDGPVPRLDTCLCLLLSIATLTVAYIVEEEKEEETMLTNEAERSSNAQRKDIGERRQELVSSLQLLGDFKGLLSPPPSVTALANQAAAKAMMHLSGNTIGLDGMAFNDMPSNCSGNLRHLIIEACIARNVLDTSAYMWPGYVKGHLNQIPRSVSGQVPGWSSLLKGSPLTLPLVNALVCTPASSLAEIERMYDIAVSGTEEEKFSAATIFCGASLSRGWNIQEYAGLSIIRLLSPAVSKDFSGSESHLTSHAPFLNAILVGISSIDSIQIFSLHGLVPQLAAALMQICEVFGSCSPNMSWTLNTGEQISSHAVFSNAFTLLLKLWRFDRPPLEHVKGDVTPIGSPLTPEYLLLVRNSQLASSKNSSKNKNKTNRLSMLSYPSSSEPILLDSFPKLKCWHRQHQECIASILSVLVPGNPINQIIEALLNMMFKKTNKGTPTNSENSSPSASGTDDSCKYPAWDILEAVPFVLDAALTACAHGRLSPRELTTGLKDLADFLPASLATIVSYLSAEVTRGLWKAASMNGTDWPSPAANLSIVEQQINKILAATGVIVPCLSVEISSQVTLPLPLAALLSLTITYKLDRDTSRFLNLIGPAVSNLGIGCPWPCMPIIAALWAQKAKRWNDFLVFSASQTVFHHNNDAIVQLLRVCFSAALGLKSSLEASNGGVGALLGHGFGSHFTGGISAVAPGILYLRVHRAVTNIMFMTEEIVSILMQTVKDIASSGFSKEKLEKPKKTKYNMNYGQVSLACAMSQIKHAASLGASLVWITGEENLVQSLIKETLPSWFISGHGLNNEESRGMVATLDGYALAYFILICGLFAWGVDSTSPTSTRRPKVLAKHLGFLASVLDGKISLGCNKATWRAYVTGFTSLMVTCTPSWIKEVDLEVLKRVSKGLKQWKEEELALALLSTSGFTGMGAAAEMIIETRF